MPTRRTLLSIPTLVGALVFGACGGDDESADTTRATTTIEAPATTLADVPLILRIV